ncbi:telomeric repeat-binding factor 2-interacting protein 1 [Candoia aspera]|uniref:telomeric repeat-binding factor 2-interacting protein 1 n=1 Tax=Candoia aspera TaxID=51853 RepID=UPI002FD82852
MEGGRAEGARAPALFRRANREFEEREEDDGENSSSTEDIPPEHLGLKTSEETVPPKPKVRVLGEDLAMSSIHVPEREGPSSSMAAEVATAVKDMKRFMGEFNVDLATVTQAFLKNSGEVAAVANCLQTGQRSDGYPLWNRQDDVVLLKGQEGDRNNLETKYGVENVSKRVGFRTS